MSTQAPIKSSSRAGRFKKKLVTEEVLQAEAPIMAARMAPILENFHQGIISPAEFAALYVLITLAHRHPGDWPGAKRKAPLTPSHELPFKMDELIKTFEPNVQRRLTGLHTLGEIFQFFAFKATPESVNRSLLGWSVGSYGLELMFRIPTPQEVLTQQKQGRRCVTIVLDPKKASRFILGERDALGFTMHDLIHADHFYHHNHSYVGQLGFYGFLDHCLAQKHFDELLLDSTFEGEFEYLISDMNAYAVHLLKCFKSALVHYHPLKDQFFRSWLQKLDLNETQRKAWVELNTESYQGSQDEVLLSFLANWKQIP